MLLTIQEQRGTSTLVAGKDGYDEVSLETRSLFHWKLSGVGSAKVDDKGLFYDIAATSQGFDQNFGGFASRDDAITNALTFAKYHGIEVDGYSIRGSG